MNYKGNVVVIVVFGSGKIFVILEKICDIFDGCFVYKGVVVIFYINKVFYELKECCFKNGFNLKLFFFGIIDKFYIGEIIILFGKYIWGLL